MLKLCNFYNKTVSYLWALTISRAVSMCLWLHIYELLERWVLLYGCIDIISCGYVEIKCHLDTTEVFIADHCLLNMFWHHYAHYQELKGIIQRLLPVVFRAVVFKLLVWCGAEGYVSGMQDAAASCKPDTQPSAPHQTNNLKTTAQNTTGSNRCIILLSSWWWA